MATLCILPWTAGADTPYPDSSRVNPPDDRKSDALPKITVEAERRDREPVLRLFVAPEASQGFSQLSAWAAAFLKALYSTEQANKMQRSSIITSMMRDAAISP